MIQLTRLNKQPLALNSDLIKFIEYAPDTVITLVNGEKIVVLEAGEQILDKIIEFRRRIISGLKTNSDGCVLTNDEELQAKHQGPRPGES